MHSTAAFKLVHVFQRAATLLRSGAGITKWGKVS